MTSSMCKHKYRLKWVGRAGRGEGGGVIGEIHVHTAKSRVDQVKAAVINANTACKAEGSPRSIERTEGKNTACTA